MLLAVSAISKSAPRQSFFCLALRLLSGNPIVPAERHERTRALTDSGQMPHAHEENMTIERPHTSSATARTWVGGGLLVLAVFVSVFLPGSCAARGAWAGTEGRQITTLTASEFPTRAADTASVLYVDRKLWEMREQPIRRFLCAHLRSPQFWPIEIRDNSVCRNAVGVSEPLNGGEAPLCGQEACDLRAVIVAADNAISWEELLLVRKSLSGQGRFHERHWMIMAPPADRAGEYQDTEIVIFSSPMDEPNATENRWGMARLLNPFARPMPTTDRCGSGDINLDGAFDFSDLICTEEITAGSREPTERADVDGDGRVDLNDVTAMQEVLSGSREYLPGWWGHLRTREERNNWVDRMLAIDKTDDHPYQDPFFVCRDFASILVLNNIGYDGSFHGEPSKWITPGRFNLPMHQVILAEVPHAMTAILVGDSPLDFDSWRFIEPQTDTDGSTLFVPGERIFIQVSSSFSALGKMSSARALVVFQLDENGNVRLDHADPELVTIRMGDVAVYPPDPVPGQVVSFTAMTCREGISEASVILRPSGISLETIRVPLYDDGLHDDGAAGDGLWGGSAAIDRQANIFVDLEANLVAGGQIMYQQASWLTTADGKWHVSPLGSDSYPGTRAEPFSTIGHAMKVAFPGDTIEIAPAFYPELCVINKGGLEISGGGSRREDVRVSELRVDYGTGISINDLSCQSVRVHYASDPVFTGCGIEETFESVDACVNLRNSRVRQVEAFESSVHLWGNVISNADGPGVSIDCPSTTEPSLVELEIVNCTIVSSLIGVLCTADSKDYPCSLSLLNSILWENAADFDDDCAQIHPMSCDIESGWPGKGGNISADPRFVDSSAGDYSLRADSPCIDAGVNEDWMWGTLDLGGNPRIFPGECSWRADIGAYEYIPPVYEFKNLIRPAEETVELTWTSRPGSAYTIWSSADLLAARWTEEKTLPAAGTICRWTDAQASFTVRGKFYKIEQK